MGTAVSGVGADKGGRTVGVARGGLRSPALGSKGGGDGANAARRSKPFEAKLQCAAGACCSRSPSAPQRSSCPGGKACLPSLSAGEHAPACEDTRACCPGNSQAI
eukprot:6182266-Pleurochrysis_carterae.AAC.1